ncbi:MAG: hypothetical protein ACI9JE_000726 [Candidatus Krumholzibacteriia bacterium]|jgi:hypothetical protein
MVLMPVQLMAQDSPPLGHNYLAGSMGPGWFSDSSYLSSGAAFGLGLEYYRAVTDQLYLGAEVSSLTNVDIFGDDITVSPLELNLKYAVEVGGPGNQGFVVAAGAGLAYAHVDVADYEFFDAAEYNDGWVFGGQIYGEGYYNFGKFMVGMKLKFQPLQKLVAEFEGAPTNVSLKLQLGLNF